MATATSGLGDVRPHAEGVQINHRLVAVIPLVGDELGQRRRQGTRGVSGLDLLGGGDHRLDETRRIADVGAVQRDGDHHQLG